MIDGGTLTMCTPSRWNIPSILGHASTLISYKRICTLYSYIHIHTYVCRCVCNGKSQVRNTNASQFARLMNDSVRDSIEEYRERNSLNFVRSNQQANFLLCITCVTLHLVIAVTFVKMNLFYI